MLTAASVASTCHPPTPYPSLTPSPKLSSKLPQACCSSDWHNRAGDNNNSRRMCWLHLMQPCDLLSPQRAGRDKGERRGEERRGEG